MRWMALTALVAAVPVCVAGLACRDGGSSCASQSPAKVQPAAVEPFQMGRPDAVLLITAGTNGMLEVCNCAGAMPGGLSKRSGLVRSYRAAFERVFLLDAGDALYSIAGSIRNDYVLRAYRQVGYDAVVLGDQEWALPADRLGRLLRDEPMAYLCTNVSPAAGGAFVAQAVRKQWGEVKLAVIADVGEDALMFLDERARNGLKIARTDWAGQVAQLRQEGFAVLAVVHSLEESAEVAAASAGVDLIVLAHRSKPGPQLARRDGVPVVQVGGHEHVGAVALRLEGGRIKDLEYRLEVIDDRWPDDPLPMQTYQAYAHAEMRLAMDARRVKGLDYVASSQCGSCHETQHKFWQSSRHARAYATLQKARRTGDPNCLACHTSGFGTESGFYTLKKTPQLAGVNCQDCHRFNLAEHMGEDFKAPKADEAVCTACHTPITDPKFDMGTKLPKVRCPHE